MPRTLVSLGANLGSVHESMLAAKRMLIDAFGASHLRWSRLYRTPPIGGPEDQSDFLNAVVAIDSPYTCWEIWETIKRVETELGRQRRLRWEARRIDLDLILHDQQRVWTPHLKIPHPRMCMRSFVLNPALDVAPDWLEPVTGWTMERFAAHIATSAQQPSKMRVISQSASQQDALRDRWMSSQRDACGPEIDWVVWEPNRKSVADTSQDANSPASWLTIAAVASPDPTTILWEDYSRPWVEWLNMNTCSDATLFPPSDTSISGPRYLLPLHDLDWAVQEIVAADQAMRCPLEAVDSL